MARPRTPSTVTHMVIAMAIVLVPVALVSWFFTRLPSEPPVMAIDPAAYIAKARKEAPYPVAAPTNLPDGWVAVRVRWTPEGEPLFNKEPAVGSTWQLGYLTPEKMYIALDQRDRLPEQFVGDVTRAGRPAGESSVGGVAWQRYTSADARTHSLVQRGDQAVTIVSGDVTFEELEAFTGTLATR